MSRSKKDDSAQEKTVNQAEKSAELKDGFTVEDDPVLDKMVLVFLALFLLAVIFIPQEWFLKWSMWWNGIK